MGDAAMQEAVLGGGCFWCLEAVFERIEGVDAVVSGYAGGSVPSPTYEQVCTGTTGHAEVVQVRFRPDVVSYRQILEIFFAMHDPTTANRQGADAGTQYRSVILWSSAEQERTARELVRDFDRQGIFGAPIVTQLAKLDAFYPAEIDHQEYYARNPDKGYCRVVISPKVTKLRKTFADKLKPSFRQPAE